MPRRYGVQRFPSNKVGGRNRNYGPIPFPLVESHCQPKITEGVQTTRDRPFTIAELKMQKVVESELSGCLRPPAGAPCTTLLRPRSVLPSAISPLGGSLGSRGLLGGNCSTVCPVFFDCVHRALQTNRTPYARARCLETPQGQMCAARTKAQFVEQGCASSRLKIGCAQGTGVYTRVGGFEGVCLAFDCLHCAVALSYQHFRCAVTCTTDGFLSDCIDCSYTYDNSHVTLLQLRDRLWEAYFLGALAGEYAVADMLRSNFTTCALRNRGCMTLANYETRELGIDDAPDYLNSGILDTDEDDLFRH